MARDTYGPVRELLRHHFEIYSTGLDVTVFHIHNGSVLGKVPQAPKPELLVRMVLLAFSWWN